jgi:hypothetical protein
MTILRSVALVFALTTAACTGFRGSAAPTERGGKSGTIEGPCVRGEAACSNPIDRLVVPRLVALGLEPPRPDAAPSPELCRRLAIDVLGRGPTADETKTCIAAKSVSAIVDAWMLRPEHEHLERRAWSELVQYDVSMTWYQYIVDADDLVGLLAKGGIGYDAFAARFVIHPALYSRHPDDDWTREIFSLFLGRTARPDEVRAMRPLVGIWTGRNFVDPKLEKETNHGYPSSRELGFDFCACESGTACTSTALGQSIDLRGACEKPKTAPSARTKSIPGYGAGDLQAPTAVRDLAIGAEKDPLPRANVIQEKKLLSIGMALAARPDFWEAEVDRELRRYLGWWQTGFKRPETDLPDVRMALAERLAKENSVRALRRTILTSVLYTMPATVTETKKAKEKGNERALPAWSGGPRKLLAGEAWLDTMASAIGEDLGSCDHRFLMRRYAGLMDDDDEKNGYTFYNRNLYVEPSLLTAVDRPSFHFDYESAASRLGGCGGVGTAGGPRSSTLGLVRAEHDLATALCANGRALVPGKGDLEDDARALVSRFLARPATSEEAKRLAEDMRACMKPSGSEPPACADRGVAVRWLCTRIAVSPEFGTY